MRGQIINLTPTEEKKGTLTIEKLWALYVTLLHLLTFVCCRLHITDGGGKDGSTRLHQYLTQVHAVTGGGTMQGRPTHTDTRQWVSTQTQLAWTDWSISFTITDPTKCPHQPSLSAAFTLTPKSSRNLTMWWCPAHTALWRGVMPSSLEVLGLSTFKMRGIK